MLKTFWELLLALYDNERELVTLAREKGYLLPKPSSILTFILGLFYLLSPYDIISESLIPNSFLGYIDDIIVLIILGGYIYTDVKEMLNFEQVQVSDKHISEDKQSTREASIHSTKRHDDNSSDTIVTTDSSVASDREVIGNNDAGNISDIDNDTSIDGVDIESDNEYTEPKQPGGWKNEI